MKGDSLMVGRDHLEALAACLRRNLAFLSAAIVIHVNNAEYAAFLESKLAEIQHCMDGVYSPELRELKDQARTLYQKYLGLKDTDLTMAHAAYRAYRQLKSRMAQREDTWDDMA